MLLKYFYDDALAHASYLVGCQRAKTAVVIDPGRDIDQYIEMAQREGLTVSAVAETHIHADYVSGARELADRVGTKLYLSDEGPSNWKYEYAKDYDAKLVTEGDSFMVGNIKFDVMHTPGHTPESISFLLTDQGGGATEPMGIFTGDFVFVGSIGRPDLLEEAAGVVGSAEVGARQLFASAERFKSLKDHLQVWPAHGAGSACGKGLGAIPSSTVGYEKLFNPALQFTDEEEFVRYILADQPEAPTYFALMKRVNKEGPDVLGKQVSPTFRPLKHLLDLSSNVQIVDLAASADFANGHVPGTINIPASKLAAWAGWLLDYSRPTYLICAENQIAEAIRVLQKIGVEEVAGVFDTAEIESAGLRTESFPNVGPAELADKIASGELKVIDVRSDSEWATGHIAHAEHRFLGKLGRQLDDVPGERTIVTQCQSGARSAIAASILQAAGKRVINMAGGMNAWLKAGFATEDKNKAGVACKVGTAGSCSL